MAPAEQIPSEDSLTKRTKTLTRGTLALHLNTVANSLLGFVFLIVAAHLYERDELGQGLALVSAMTLVAALAETNVGMALARFLPLLGTRSVRVVVYAISFSTAIAVVAAVVFVVSAPHISSEFAYFGDTATLAALFVFGVVGCNILIILDPVLVAIRAATWVPVKNFVFSFVKLICVVIFAFATVDNGVFLAWAIPAAILVLPMLFLIVAFPLRAHATEREGDPVEPRVSERQEVRFERRSLARYLGWDYVASIASQIGTTAIPLVVLATLGSSANAQFSVVFAIVIAVEQLALNAGVTLMVEGAFEQKAFAQLVRKSFLRFGGLLVAVVVVGIFSAPIATFAFGSQFGSETTDIFRLLLLGLIPETLVILFQAVARVRHQAARIAVMNCVQAAVTVGLAVVLAPHMGLAGIGWAWIIGHLVVALAVLPATIRLMNARDETSTTR